MTTHFDFFGPFLVGALDAPNSATTLGARNERTRFMKRLSTLCAVLAEVSIKSHPNCRARAAPSFLETSLSKVLSHLLPTSINIGWPRLTRIIDLRNISRRSNVDREAIEYTRMNPWPSLGGIQNIAQACGGITHRTHWSRRVAYSSEGEVVSILRV